LLLPNLLNEFFFVGFAFEVTNGPLDLFGEPLGIPAEPLGDSFHGGKKILEQNPRAAQPRRNTAHVRQQAQRTAKPHAIKTAQQHKVEFSTPQPSG
jgi:hypothetical protein